MGAAAGRTPTACTHTHTATPCAAAPTPLRQCGGRHTPQLAVHKRRAARPQLHRALLPNLPPAPQHTNHPAARSRGGCAARCPPLALPALPRLLVVAPRPRPRPAPRVPRHPLRAHPRRVPRIRRLNPCLHLSHRGSLLRRQCAPRPRPRLCDVGGRAGVVDQPPLPPPRVPHKGALRRQAGVPTLLIVPQAHVGRAHGGGQVEVGAGWRGGPGCGCCCGGALGACHAGCWRWGCP